MRSPYRLPEPATGLLMASMNTDDILDAHEAYGRASGHAAETIRSRRSHLRCCFRDLDADPRHATTTQLVTWLADRRWKQATRCSRHATLRLFYGWLTGIAELRQDDPMARLKPPRVPKSRPKPVTTAELRAALDRSDERWQLMIVLAAFAGLRVADIAALRHEDITEASITVRGGKGGKDAVLPCHPEIWRRVRDLPPGPVVRTNRGNPYTARVLSRSGQIHFDCIGLPDVTLHRFRHWFATYLLMPREHGGSGANLREVQELMRHASVATTEKYTAVVSARLAQAVASLSWAA